MQKLIAWLGACVVLCSAALAAPTLPAAPADPAHLAAVVELLSAAHVPEKALLQFSRIAATKPDDQAYIAYMATHVRNDEVARAIAPVYASQVPLATARKLIAEFNTPLGKRVTRLELARARAPEAAQLLMLSAKERIDIFTFNDGAAIAAFNKVHGLAARAAFDAMTDMMGRHSLDLLMKGMQEVALGVKASMVATSNPEPVLVVPAKVGIPYVDKVLALVATTAYRNIHAAWRVDNDLMALGMETVVAPQSLVTPAGIAKSKLTLSQVDDKIDQLMRENEETLKLFVAKFEQIDMPGKAEMQRGLQRGMERHLEWSVRFVENQRAIVDIMRRVVAFADARTGKLTAKDDALLMNDSADRALYSALVAEMQREIGRADTVRGEALERVNDVVSGKALRKSN